MPDSIIGKRISNYQIETRLGAGGMGVVFRARDVRLERPVALKFLSPNLLAGVAKERLLHEARAASALDHNNIGVIHGIEETGDGSLFIVMACYEGETLFEKIRRGPLSVGQTIDIGMQMARGLAAAHDKGIVHRDIKPSNVFVTRQGVVKLLDFGLAKFAGAAHLTEAGTAVGTATYMSPEQAFGRDIDYRTDIWSLGVVAYEMIAGKTPFRGDSTPSTLLAITTEAPPPLSQVPAELEAAIYRCLAKEPAERYQRVAEFTDDLAKVASSGEEATQTLPAVDTAEVRRRAYESARPSSSRTRAAAQARTRRLAMWIGACLLFCLAALALWVVSRAPTGTLVPSQKHVLVLPFVNVGGDPANAAICEGLLETLTSRLTSLEHLPGSLWVAPASEVRRQNITDVRAAQRALGANLVVTGSVQKDPSGVRLTLNLIDAATLRQLGSAVVDDRSGNFVNLQDEAVARLAKLLEITIDANTLAKSARESRAAPAAYESYLKGLAYLQRYDKPGNLDTAIGLFQNAVRADPRFALGFAKLAEAEWVKSEVNPDSHGMEKALVDGRTAAEVNDQLAPVHVILGRIHAGTGKYDLALQEFQRALEFDPRNAEAYQRIARAYEALGRTADAENSLRKAIVLRPDYWDAHNSLGSFYTRQKRFREAAAQFRRVLELTPDNAAAYNNLGIVLRNLNDFEGAQRAYERALALNPTYSTYNNLAAVYYQRNDYKRSAAMYEKALALNEKDYRVWGGLGSAWEAAGRADKARRAYAKTVELAESAAVKNPNDGDLLSYLALRYAKLGLRDKAANRIERAVALTPEDANVLYRAALVSELGGDRTAALKWLKAALARGYPADHAQHDPDLRNLRADPAFRALLQ